jgi:hypothetical protein
MLHRRQLEQTEDTPEHGSLSSCVMTFLRYGTECGKVVLVPGFC